MAESTMYCGVWLTQALRLVFFVLSVYFGALIVYRIAFHRLRRFPGPWMAKINIFPVALSSLTGDLHLWTAKQHEKYGPIVRISPDTLSFTCNAWKDIFAHRPEQLQKDPKSYFQPPNGVPALLSSLNDDYHHKTRKIFSPAFSEKALRAQEGVVLHYVDVLTEKLKLKVGTPILISDWYNFTTFDIMGDLLFGEHLGLLESEEYHPFVSMTFAALKYIAILRVLKRIPMLELLAPLFAPKNLKERRLAFFKFAGERVQKRLVTKTDKPDLWSFVELSSQKGNGLTYKEMESNANLFLGAGSETTATALSGLTFLLAKHPEKKKMLVDAIRAEFADEAEISMEKLAGIKYLDACIDEALRVYMPVPGSLQRRTPKEGTYICGEWIPGDCTVMMPGYATFHSTANFHDPETFAPERWLGQEPKYANDDLDAVQPFSVGPRNCIGMSFAYHEIRLIITKLLWHFDIALAPDCVNWMDGQKMYTLWEKPPLGVVLARIRID